MIAAMGMSTAMAQGKQKELSVYLGGVIPTGSFGESLIYGEPYVFWEEEKSNSAGAGFGINAGVKFKYNIPSVEGLGIFATADLFWNTSNKDLRGYCDAVVNDDLHYITEESEYGSGYYKYECIEAEITLPKFLNIPIMIGANYGFGINNDITMFGEFGLGLNIAKVTKYEDYNKYHEIVRDYEYPSDNFEGYNTSKLGKKFNIQSSFAFQIGVGLKFAEKYSIGIHYYALGNIELEGERYWVYNYRGEEDKRSEIYNTSINPSMLTIRLGYHF